jgi:hypothetical protein
MEHFSRTIDAARKYVVSGEGQIARPSFFASRREICELRESIAQPRDNAHLTVPERTIARQPRLAQRRAAGTTSATVGVTPCMHRRTKHC